MSQNASPKPAEVPFALKLLVWGMGALMVLGILGLIAGMVFKSRAGADRLAEAAALTLSPDTEIRHLALDGNRLAVHVNEGGKERILIYDAKRARVLSAIDIARE